MIILLNLDTASFLLSTLNGWWYVVLLVKVKVELIIIIIIKMSNVRMDTEARWSARFMGESGFYNTVIISLRSIKDVIVLSLTICTPSYILHDISLRLWDISEVKPEPLDDDTE